MTAPPFPAARPRRRALRTLLGVGFLLAAVLLSLLLLARSLFLRVYHTASASMRPTLAEGERLIVDTGSYRRRPPQRGHVVVFHAPPEATDGGREDVAFVMRVVGIPGDTVEVRAAELRAGDKIITWDGMSGAHDYLRARLRIAQGDAVKLLPDRLLVGGSRTVTKEELARRLGVTASSVRLTPGETRVNGSPLIEGYVNEDPGYRYGPTRLGPGELFVLGDNRNRARDSHLWGPLKRDRVLGRVRLTSRGLRL